MFKAVLRNIYTTKKKEMGSQTKLLPHLVLTESYSLPHKNQRLIQELGNSNISLSPVPNLSLLARTQSFTSSVLAATQQFCAELFTPFLKHESPSTKILYYTFRLMFPGICSGQCRHTLLAFNISTIPVYGVLTLGFLDSVL